MKKTMLILGLFFTSISFAGNHLGGWMMYYGNLSLNQSDFKLHYEYQHRNHELLSDLNQALFRTALQYNLKNQLQFSAGYVLFKPKKWMYRICLSENTACIRKQVHSKIFYLLY